LELGFAAAGFASLPPLSVRCMNRIPIGAGMGSSSAALVSGLLAALALTGKTLPVAGVEAALQLVAGVEGHADNASATLYGGMQVCVHAGGRWRTTSVPVPRGLQAVLFVPHARKETAAVRALLPPLVPRADAVFNLSRTALLATAMATGDLSALRCACEDALHQPARAGIMPALLPVIAAALAASGRPIADATPIAALEANAASVFDYVGTLGREGQAAKAGATAREAGGGAVALRVTPIERGLATRLSIDSGALKAGAAMAAPERPVGPGGIPLPDVPPGFPIPLPR
jgi:homoserine kinase